MKETVMYYWTTSSFEQKNTAPQWAFKLYSSLVAAEKLASKKPYAEG